ncbi:proton-translocating NADH-quinone oxidoreductase, chain M [Rubidibacter lacunae KORDI 51-2]|uniref:Proton-translocating NADH-quinone oxidoreductase, chain M n=1 Tax=Rubidibacter lacunae KORDI 51-2 TaxID=582515 RepID=U5DIC9_9CHRO|nr:NADH-quinone oxidoreductase subunit M [Rubidibacter lacunae]ERN41426.1 proton-translocating NADH-quinone oxidoreductase, chain M [Rubidibacter lacunae KORDI 51-2]
MLSVLVWGPVVGAVLVAFLPESLVGRGRSLALAVAVALFGWTLVLAVQVDPTQVGSSFEESVPWLSNLGLSYHLALDGLSLPLVFLNSLLTVVAIYSTNRAIERPRFFYSLVLLLAAGTVGAFLAMDLLLFFLFYEVELLPLYLLIAIWGGVRRAYAATKFLMYTALSGVLILASFLGLVWFSGAQSFDYEVARSVGLPLGIQIALLVVLLIGFGIKIPLFPLHTWLPDAHVEASTPVSVLLAGVLLKLGTYGLLRFGVGLFPDAWATLAPGLAIWAAVSALFGALAAISQQDMKRVVAYSSIAHMAYIMLAAAAATPLSLTAAVAQMVSHGLISALLFLAVGVVGKKTGTRDVNVLRGLLNPECGLPIVGSLTIVGAMASAGIPGMVGFVAEFLVFRSSFSAFPVATLLCMVGTGLTAVYFLLMINRVFFGRLPEQFAELPPVPWSDRVPAIALAVAIVVLGIQPNWLLRWSESQTAVLYRPVAAVQASPSLSAATAGPVAN